MKQILKIDDEVTALVRTRTFNGSYMLKEHIFTIKELTEKMIYGITISDGSRSWFSYSSITRINGMEPKRYLKTIKKTRKWDV